MRNRLGVSRCDGGFAIGLTPSRLNAEEVAGHLRIGTRMLGRAEADAGDEAAGETSGDEAHGTEPGGSDQSAVPHPGADGTLLAVVPIPGTDTSLAIVGYPVAARGSVAAGTVPVGTVRVGPNPQAVVRDGPVAGTRLGLRLDQDQRRVWVDGAEVALTFQEFELLAFLAAHPATVFSREDLVRQVWQRDFATDSRTVDVHVSRLRRKLGPHYGRCLVTEYRVGYQFRPM